MSLRPYSFRDLLEGCAARDAARPAFTSDGRTWTIGEMDVGANRAANALRALGIGRGDHVAVLLHNGPEMVWCWWGLAKLGAVYVPVNAQLVGEGLRHVVAHSDVCALVADASLLPTLGQALRPRPEALRHVLTPGALLAGADGASPPVADERAEDPAVIIYTSGTTGPPKGVLWSRNAQTQHARRYAAELNFAEFGESVYTSLPLFHVTSMGVVMSSVLRGARVAVDRRFDPFAHWRRVREEGAVLFPYVGAMLGLLHKRPQRPDDADNSVRWAMGAAAPAEIWEDFERRFGLRLIETWGQTELAGNWLRTPPDRPRVGSVGRPPDRLEVRLVDERGRPARDGAPGELALRATEPHSLMDGYYKQPEATARALRGGWYRSGDRLARDADGYYRYLGRLKDFIRHGGENVSAFEIERVVNTHPAVLECAAVGVPSPLGEEDVLLCVVPRPDAPAIEPEAIYAYCRERLPAFMRPRYVRVLDALPKTATQRTQKYRLAEQGVGDAWDRRTRARDSLTVGASA